MVHLSLTVFIVAVLYKVPNSGGRKERQTRLLVRIDAVVRSERLFQANRSVPFRRLDKRVPCAFLSAFLAHDRAHKATACSLDRLSCTSYLLPCTLHRASPASWFVLRASRLHLPRSNDHLDLFPFRSNFSSFFVFLYPLIFPRNYQSIFSSILLSSRSTNDTSPGQPRGSIGLRLDSSQDEAVLLELRPPRRLRKTQGPHPRAITKK